MNKNERRHIIPRKRTRFLVRHIVPSDSHEFIGRIYDLSIVAMSFDTYADLARYPDCKYAIDTNTWVSSLALRVESLNLAGKMLWPDTFPHSFQNLPITSYEWLTITTDVFLIRYASVLDCALLLINQVFRLGLRPRDCTFRNVRERQIPRELVNQLLTMLNDQEALRVERNERIHHGSERSFTDDDMTFKMASLLGVVGHDRFGRKINVDRSFREGLVGLQREFNSSTRRLKHQLDQLYDLLWVEFEDHFGPLIANATHGLNAKSIVRKT
jgi:hypothetical protein